jgi:hypothetical protein
MRLAVALLLLAEAAYANGAPDAGAPGAKLLPAFMFIREQVEHPQPIVPASFAEAHAGATASPVYKVCVGADGRVSDVLVVNGIGDSTVDSELIQQLRAKWRYKPRNDAACFIASLRFVFDDPVMIKPPEPQLEPVAHPVLSLPRYFMDSHPRDILTATYKFCVDTTGRIFKTSIISPLGGGVDEHLMQQMQKRWTYKPRARPGCAIEVMRFQIN